ncbi:MAG: cytochrome C peroxidase [Pseudobacteriovorax sp.]|nr:cytochrome C peroxidase [Pseudobacteriovorax sp.]
MWSIRKILTALAVLLSFQAFADGSGFTKADIKFLQTLSLDHLPKQREPIGNRFADDIAVAKLGHRLFFDSRLSANEMIACASCHRPELHFTDGLPQSKGMATVKRNAPSVLTSSWGPWQYWDGRKDSQWSQALEPFENPKEHDIHRLDLVVKIYAHYKDAFTQAFGKAPPAIKLPANSAKTAAEHYQGLTLQERQAVDETFVKVGKALMAYQRQLQLPDSRFDRFVRELTVDPKTPTTLSSEEINGLRLFVGKARCVSCHNGALFTNFEFHNVGVPELNTEDVDLGRWDGAKTLSQDVFTCLSSSSDAERDDCLEMRFLKTEGAELVGAFKTPSLRNVAATGPYMHGGQFLSLKEVVEHYNKPRPPFYDRQQHPFRPHFDIQPLGLNDDELAAIVAFLGTLTSPLPKDDPWWWFPAQPLTH